MKTSEDISIFCAALLNQAVFSCFIEQILVAPYPRGCHLELGVKLKFSVGFFLFVCSFCLINVLCFRFKHNDRQSYAVSTIGGHLCAFVGIFTFGELQQRKGIKNSPQMCIASCFSHL